MFYNRILNDVEKRCHSLSLVEFARYWSYAEQRSRPITLWLQLQGIAAWLFGLFVSSQLTGYRPALLALHACGLVACLLLSRMGPHQLLKLMGKSAYALLLAHCLYTLTQYSEHGMFWSLVILVMIVVGMSPLFYEPVSFLASTIGVNLVMLRPYFAEFLASPELMWFLCFLSSLLIFSLCMNYLFFRERFSVYLSQRQLAELAYTDSLTRLFNRRAFLHTVEELLRDEANRHGLFLFIIDVDNFKGVNDMHGHERGDVVLREIADRVHAVTTSQRCGRLGGEEFGALMLGSLADAEAMARELNRAVAQRPIEEMTITISIGVAAYREGESLAELLADADCQLYLAKKAGKNRFAISPFAHDPMPPEQVSPCSENRVVPLFNKNERKIGY